MPEEPIPLNVDRCCAKHQATPGSLVLQCDVDRCQRSHRVTAQELGQIVRVAGSNAFREGNIVLYLHQSGEFSQRVRELL